MGAGTVARGDNLYSVAFSKRVFDCGCRFFAILIRSAEWLALNGWTRDDCLLFLFDGIFAACTCRAPAWRAAAAQQSTIPGVCVHRDKRAGEAVEHSVGSGAATDCDHLHSAAVSNRVAIGRTGAIAGT